MAVKDEQQPAQAGIGRLRFLVYAMLITLIRVFPLDILDKMAVEERSLITQATVVIFALFLFVYSVLVGFIVEERLVNIGVPWHLMAGFLWFLILCGLGAWSYSALLNNDATQIRYSVIVSTACKLLIELPGSLYLALMPSKEAWAIFKAQKAFNKQ